MGDTCIPLPRKLLWTPQKIVDQSWTLYKSADCRWISITILCVSFTNSATVGRLEQVQLCNQLIDQSADKITDPKCAKECLILKYNYIQNPWLCKNYRKQRKFFGLLGYISKSILMSSDSFCLIASHWDAEDTLHKTGKCCCPHHIHICNGCLMQLFIFLLNLIVMRHTVQLPSAVNFEILLQYYNHKWNKYTEIYE